MEYERDGKKYKGFNRLNKPPDTHIAPAMLVIAWFDGEPDLWLVQDWEGVEELRRFYTEEWGDTRIIPFTICVVFTTRGIHRTEV